MPSATNIETLSTASELLFSANTTNTTALAAQIPVSTRPASDTDGGVAIVTMSEGDGNDCYNLLELMFFGTDADNETLNVHIIGYARTSTGFVPAHVWSGTATLSNSVTGAAGITPNGTSDYFADAIAYSSGDSNAISSVGKGDEVADRLIVDGYGFPFVKVLIDRGTAASGNGFYRRIK